MLGGGARAWRTSETETKREKIAGKTERRRLRFPKNGDVMKQPTLKMETIFVI